MRQLIKEFLNMPMSIRIGVLVLALVFIGGVVVLLGIPTAILLIAFPKLWILIGVFGVLLVIGYRNRPK